MPKRHLLLWAAVGSACWIFLGWQFFHEGSPRSSTAPCAQEGPPEPPHGTQDLSKESPLPDVALECRRIARESVASDVEPRQYECRDHQGLASLTLSQLTDDRSKRVWNGLPLSLRAKAERLTGEAQTRFAYSADTIIQDYRNAVNKFWATHSDGHTTKQQFENDRSLETERELMKQKLIDLLKECSE